MLTTRQETEERLAEFIGRRRTPVRFNVAPRYTPGSPAQVPLETALRVAAQERQSYAYARDARYGVGGVEKAQREGLLGIVEAVCETRKGWDTLDLVTGERRLVPFEARR